MLLVLNNDEVGTDPGTGTAVVNPLLEEVGMVLAVPAVTEEVPY